MKQSKTQLSFARLIAVQTLFEIDQTQKPYKIALQEMLNRDSHELLDDSAELDFSAYAELAQDIVGAAVKNQSDIDRACAQSLSGKWELHQIDPTFRAIFRAAGAEYVNGRTPKKVIINEYLDIAKAFDDERPSIGFMNAVLDKMLNALTVELPFQGE